MPPKVEKCMTIFLWPFYLVDSIGLHLGPEATNTRFSLSPPWREVPDGERLWEHARATEYFDPQTLCTFSSEWEFPDFLVIYDQPSRTCRTSWRITPVVTVFASGFCILRLRGVPENDLTLPELINFNEHFRYLKLMEFQRTKLRETYCYRVSWIGEWERKVASEQFLHTGELLNQILGSFLPCDVKPSPCLEGFSKMICCSAVIADGVQPRDRFRLATVDEADSFLPHEDYWRRLEGAVHYSRWEPHQFFAFTNYSMCWLMDKSIPGWLEEQAFSDHMPVLYAGIIGQTLVHQCGALSVLSRDLALIEADPGQRGFAGKARDLRREILNFTNHAWFERVTFEVQGHEMYCAWREALEVEGLFKEVQRELEETDDWLRAERAETQNRLLAGLQRWVAAVAFTGIALAAIPGAFGESNMISWVAARVWGLALAFGGVGFLLAHLTLRRGAR
ncbi:MAG TPA: hypothetical protein VMY18_10805 [Acidobacteriota bacterium]|nr:hypothetical protein [Acidobacteriota bacterium]